MLSRAFRFFFTRQASDTKQPGILLPELPNEVLDHICKYLKLSTLLSVARVNHRFYSIVSEFTIFELCLNQYYPNWKQNALAKTLNAYKLFNVLYNKEFETVTPEVLKLYDLALNAEYEQLEKFSFDPDILFQRDAYSNFVILRIIKLKDIRANDILFNNILNWFKNEVQKLPNYTTEMVFSYNTPQKMSLLDFAFCFNKDNFIANYKYYLKPLLINPYFDTRFQMMCYLGHVEIAKQMIDEYPFIYDPKYDHLLDAVKGGHTEMVEFLLLNQSYRITRKKKEQAMLRALQDNNIDILKLFSLSVENLAELIVTTYPKTWEEIILRSLRFFAQHGWDDMVEHILTYLVMTELVPDVGEYLHSHPEILVAAASHERLTTVNLLLSLGADPKHIDHLKETLTIDEDTMFSPGTITRLR